MDKKEYKDNEQTSLEGLYNLALSEMKNATYEADYLRAATRFYGLRGYKDATELESRCRMRAEKLTNDALLDSAKYQMKSDTVYGYREALKLLRQVKNRMETKELITLCERKIKELGEREQKLKRHKKAWLILLCSVALTALVVGVVIWINPTPVLEYKPYGDGMIVIALKQSRTKLLDIPAEADL